MKKRMLEMGLVILVAFVVAMPARVLAQETTPMTPQEKRAERRNAIKEKVQSLTPEQKAELKKNGQTAVANLKNLTPQQKADLKNTVTESVNNFKTMSPEEKAALKNKLDTYKNLTPEQKDSILNSIFQKATQ